MKYNRNLNQEQPGTIVEPVAIESLSNEELEKKILSVEEPIKKDEEKPADAKEHLDAEGKLKEGFNSDGSKIVVEPTAEEKKLAEEKIATEKTEKLTVRKKKAGLKPEATLEELKAKEVEMKIEVEEDEEDTELKLENVADKKTETENDEISWTALGKETGLEVKEDTYEAFVAATKEHESKIREEEKSKSYEVALEKFTPQAQKLIKYLDADGDFESFVNPTKKHDELISMDSKELVKTDLVLKGFTEEKANEKIAVLEEKEELDDVATELRHKVQVAKNATIEKVITDKIAEKETLKTKFAELQVKENKEIRDAIMAQTEFLGTKIKPEILEQVAKRSDQGDYRKRFESDPKFVSKAILAYEFSEQLIKQARKEEFQKGRDKSLDLLSNKKKLGETSQSIKADDGKEGFDKWELIYGQNEK